MLILRGIYTSGIIVDQKHGVGEKYSTDERNNFYRKFVTMLLDNPIDEDDILISVEWVNENGYLAI